LPLPALLVLFHLLLEELKLEAIENIVVALYHLQSSDEIVGSVSVQIHWPELWLDVDLRLLLQFVLSHLLHLHE